MVKLKNLGWIFQTDNISGTPYFQCPHCGRKVGGATVLFAPEDMNKCPDCQETLHFNSVRDEDWDYIYSFYGEDQ